MIIYRQGIHNNNNSSIEYFLCEMECNSQNDITQKKKKNSTKKKNKKKEVYFNSKMTRR